MEEWKSLRSRIGGPRLLAKRDDTTGLAYGGNKSRHFEFEMAHVRNQGFDTLICINNFHSNHARVAAAGCVKAGIRYILVSVGETERPLQGNLLLVKLMGGEIHRLPAGGGFGGLRRSHCRQGARRGREPVHPQRRLVSPDHRDHRLRRGRP